MNALTMGRLATDAGFEAGLELFAEELPLGASEQGEFVLAKSGNTWGSVGCFCTASTFGGTAATVSSGSTASSFPTPLLE